MTSESIMLFCGNLCRESAFRLRLRLRPQDRFPRVVSTVRSPLEAASRWKPAYDHLATTPARTTETTGLTETTLDTLGDLSAGWRRSP